MTETLTIGTRELVLPAEPEDLFRIYEPDECGGDGYPYAWHTVTGVPGEGVKDIVRANAGHRCIRCGHPYRKGQHSMEPDPDVPGGMISWSPCDGQCTHQGPVRLREAATGDVMPWVEHDLTEHGQTAADARLDDDQQGPFVRYDVEARYRILTVHHLLRGNDAKRNLRWWNLVSLCQRCHLRVQRQVDMHRVYPWPHTDWFRPYAAGWYAWAYLGEHLTRDAVMARLDELLALEGAPTGGGETA